MQNPMEEFKKSFTKTYNIQGKKFLFRSLSTKETDDIEKEVARKTVSLTDDSKFNTRKVETLAISLISVDGIALSKFEEVQVAVSKGIAEKEAIKEEISSWDESFTTLLFLFYLEMLKEKDKKFEKDAEFLNSISK